MTFVPVFERQIRGRVVELVILRPSRLRLLARLRLWWALGNSTGGIGWITTPEEAAEQERWFTNWLGQNRVRREA